jgi:uncharacterized membrane protein
MVAPGTKSAPNPKTEPASRPAATEHKMKYGDIQKLHAAGLITDEQRQKIIDYFQLKEDGGNKFLAIVSIVGAVLIAAGIALLIAAHWNGIPRGEKIGAGLLLMLGFHAGGWWLREGGGDASSPGYSATGASPLRGKYRKTGDALHLVGSCLFLANIALIGQIYNIVSRPPNAFLLWWIGIAALPWLLRSKAQHILLLIAFGIWFGFEVNERGGLIYCESDRQVLLYALLGLVYLGAGYYLRRTRFSEFAGVTEKLGLLAFLIFTYPLTWKEFFGEENPELRAWFFPASGLFALLLLAAGIRNLKGLTGQWRWTWFAALFGMMLFMATVWFGCWQFDHTGESRHYFWGESWSYLVGILALFIFCLLQIQVGLQERSSFLVNLGVVFVALDIIAAYFDLFGSMARTGVMFLISGIFLIVFGVYLEKKRRKLMRQIKLQSSDC